MTLQLNNILRHAVASRRNSRIQDLQHNGILLIWLVLQAALGSGLAQPLTEMCTQNIFLGSRRLSVCEVDDLAATCEPTVCTMWVLHHLTTLYASCDRRSFGQCVLV
jgi:hypothetical protein